MPRHSPRTGFGDERMAFNVGRRAAVCWDCWTRVLRRSAGWSRMEEVRPEQRPAAKWKLVLDAAESRGMLVMQVTSKETEGHTGRGAGLDLRHHICAVVRHDFLHGLRRINPGP